MTTETRAKSLPCILTALVILADQVSKAAITAIAPKGNTFIADVFGNDLMWIMHVRNKAIAFSLGHGLPDAMRGLLFIVLPVAVIALLAVYYFKTSDFSRLQRWSIAGIVGGGIGNLIDRIFRPDGVVDFVSVKFYGLFGLDRWPTFNVADSAVVVCGILLFASILFSKPKNLKESSK